MALPAHNFLRHLQFFKVGEIMVSKYERLMLPGAFPGKVTGDIDFAVEAVVQCDRKYILMLNTYVLFLELASCMDVWF